MQRASLLAFAASTSSVAAGSIGKVIQVTRGSSYQRLDGEESGVEGAKRRFPSAMNSRFAARFEAMKTKMPFRSKSAPKPAQLPGSEPEGLPKIFSDLPSILITPPSPVAIKNAESLPRMRAPSRTASGSTAKLEAAKSESRAELKLKMNLKGMLREKVKSLMKGGVRPSGTVMHTRVVRWGRFLQRRAGSGSERTVKSRWVRHWMPRPGVPVEGLLGVTKK